MKTTTISTASLNNATRQTRVDLQVKLAQGQKEASTGRLADVGLSLGYLTERTVSLRQDLDRLKTFKDTNTVASSRLELTQATLDGVASQANDFLQTLQAARSTRMSAGVVVTDSKTKIEALTASLNTAVNGAYIFAGVNTDVKPLGDGFFTDPPSAAQTAVTDAFTTEFGFPPGDPQAANITGAQMKAFLDGPFSDLFSSADWTSTWSSASDQNITSRISTNDRIETSANANDGSFRGLAAAYTMISELGIDGLGDEAYQAVVDKAVAVTGQASGDLTQLQAGLGTSQERIKAANDRIDVQTTLMTNQITDLEGVDPYEATANVNALLTQIETAYALTARLQNLSLIKYI